MNKTLFSVWAVFLIAVAYSRYLVSDTHVNVDVHVTLTEDSVSSSNVPHHIHYSSPEAHTHNSDRRAVNRNTIFESLPLLVGTSVASKNISTHCHPQKFGENSCTIEVGIFGKVTSNVPRPKDNEFVNPQHPSLIPHSLSRLTVSDSTFNPLDSLTVSYSIAGGSCSDDFIGIYDLDSQNQKATNYFDLEYTNGLTKGNQIWTLIHVRKIFQFRLFSKQRAKCQGKYELLAVSTVKPNQINEPTGIHLQLSKKNDEMVVMWVSANKLNSPHVEFGLNENSLTSHNEASLSTTYTHTDLCNAPATGLGSRLFIDPGYHHTAVMNNLKPQTRYYYRVGAGEVMSKIFSFVTLPSSSSETITWSILADMGTGEVRSPGAPSTMDQVAESVSRGRSQGVFHAGDLSYSRGVSVFWDKWMQHLQPITSTVPYMVGVGNHEHDSTGEKVDASGYKPYHPHAKWANYGDDSHGECSVPVIHRFKGIKSTPSGEKSNSVFWYSFQIGSATFVAWSSEHDVTESSPQYRFLEATLKSLDRTKFPWLIMLGHRPVFGLDVVSAHFRENIGKLMTRYKVDFSFVGHIHSYARSFPIDVSLWDEQEKAIILDNHHPSTPNSWGTIEILIGNAGYHIDGSQTVTVHQPCNGKNKEGKSKFYCAARDNQYGFGEIVFNNESFTFNYYHSKNEFGSKPVETVTLTTGAH